MRNTKSPVASFTQLAIEHDAWCRQRWREGGRKACEIRWKRERERKEAARRQRREAAKGVFAKPMLAGLAGWKVMLVRMMPRTDAWYALPDLVTLMPEYSRNGVKAYLYQKAGPTGLLERALNPLHDANRPPGRQSEPRYLFRLSPEGEKKAAEWAQRLSEGSGTAEGG